MMNRIDHIVEHLFHKSRLEDVSETELEEFIASYPYFAAGHFLLAKKTQANDSASHSKQLGKTSLYYSNALWLQWLLDQEVNNVRLNQTREEATANVNRGETLQEQTFESVPVRPATIVGEPEAYNSPSVPLNVGPESVESVLENDVSDLSAPEAKLPTTDKKEEQFESAEQFVTAADETLAPQDTSLSPDASFGGTEGETIAGSTPPEAPTAIENISPEEDTLEQKPADLEAESTPIDENKAEEAKELASAASIGRALSTAALIPTKAEIEKNEITFEPYHTIDYFASQGIRLQQSDLSKDKFGKQLKSFTEWLRSMKRLPQAEVETNMDEATRQSIQAIAEHSFEEKEIVTETMAEVWIKQGNKEKAIDTLNKLSLLDPSKSHYFAAKIEQLKAS
jgi:hypothetical protein